MIPAPPSIISGIISGIMPGIIPGIKSKFSKFLVPFLVIYSKLWAQYVWKLVGMLVEANNKDSFWSGYNYLFKLFNN